jgi:hypothetical protein
LFAGGRKGLQGQSSGRTTRRAPPVRSGCCESCTGSGGLSGARGEHQSVGTRVRRHPARRKEGSSGPSSRGDLATRRGDVRFPLHTWRRNSPRQERRVLAEGTRGTRTSVRARPLDRDDPNAAVRVGPDPDPPRANLSPDQFLNLGPVAPGFEVTPPDHFHLGLHRLVLSTDSQGTASVPGPPATSHRAETVRDDTRRVR